MTVAVNDLIDSVELILNDSGNDRWSAAELITYLNMGQKDIVTRSRTLGLRPAYTKTLPIQLQAGPKQVITSCKYQGSVITDCTEILHVHRNMGRLWISGTAYAVGDAVYDSSDSYARYVCIIAVTSATAPSADSTNWESSTESSGDHIEEITEANMNQLYGNWADTDENEDSSIIAWIPIDSSRKDFYVYPRQPRAEHATETNKAFQFVEITYLAVPATAAVDGNIALDDMYQEALIDFILYRAFLKDDDVADGQAPRATLFYQAYTNNSVFQLR